MHTRESHPDTPIPLPAQWAFDAKKVLNTNYRKQCDKEGYAFDIYGMIHQKEILVAISYYHPERLEAIPLTCIISIDLGKDDDIVQKLNFMVDASTILFDSYFSDGQWDGHSAYWQEANHNKQKFYYQVTRENIALSAEADRLLAAAEMEDQNKKH